MNEQSRIDFAKDVALHLQERGIDCEFVEPGGYTNLIKFNDGQHAYLGPYIVYNDTKPDDIAKSLEAQWLEKKA